MLLGQQGRSPPLASRHANGPYRGIASSVRPPPKPAIFYGRDEYVSAAVELVLGHKPARIAVTGAGGIGKTSVALHIFHDQRVREYFGDRRYFVGCEAMASADAAAERLAHALSLGPSKDLLDDIARHLESQPRTLLLIDNLETIWKSQDDSEQSATERFLKTIAGIDTVTLIVTVRGVALPPDLRWSNTETSALGVLAPDAARHAFTDIAGKSYESNAIESSATDTLMSEVQYMPLAIALLGQLAQRGNSPSSIASAIQKRSREQVFGR